jgi:hypothetical protein
VRDQGGLGVGVVLTLDDQVPAEHGELAGRPRRPRLASRGGRTPAGPGSGRAERRWPWPGSRQRGNQSWPARWRLVHRHLP